MVDDEPELLETFRRWLGEEGFQVDSYVDPELAWLDFKPYYYDMHITDIRMPKINGFEVARRIMQQDPKAPICFVTSFDAIEEAINVVSPGNEKLVF